MSAYSDGGILAGETVDAAAPILTGGRARAAAPLGGAGAFGARTGRGGPDRDRSRNPAAGVPGRLLRHAAP
ncbi:hypothetical protein [Streptomyces sp. NPDC001380]|uniref:hypothetical protein n=1 Tax=Streptomyces sp. NPDC001380 TaxID=3364566 RepID=UPI0036AF9E92